MKFKKITIFSVLLGLIFLSIFSNSVVGNLQLVGNCGSIASCQEKFNSTNVLIFSKLNENSGFNATDSSGNNNHGNTSVDSWTSGKLNNGLNFNVIGRNQSITYPNIDYSFSDFSIEFWLYNYDLFSRMVYLNDWAWLGGTNGILIIQLFGVVAFYFFDYWNGTNYFMMTTPKPTTVDWYHFCFTFDLSNVSDSKWYQNGVENIFGQTLIGNPQNTSNNVPLVIGDAPIAFYQSPNGTMDNFIFYTTKLTANEVKSQYNKGVGYEGYPDADNPYWYNLNITPQFPEVLEFGLNATVEVDACDISNVSEVLIEYDEVNYSMTNIYNNTWSNLGQWKPTLTNYRFFRLFFIDGRNNTCWIKRFIFVVSSPIIFMGLTITGVLMLGMVYFYLRVRKFLVILTVFLFSIVFGISALFIASFPFTPYFQLFFIAFQSVMFLKTTQDYYNYTKRY